MRYSNVITLLPAMAMCKVATCHFPASPPSWYIIGADVDAPQIGHGNHCETHQSTLKLLIIKLKPRYRRRRQLPPCGQLLCDVSCANRSIDLADSLSLSLRRCCVLSKLDCGQLGVTTGEEPRQIPLPGLSHSLCASCLSASLGLLLLLIPPAGLADE